MLKSTPILVDSYNGKQHCSDPNPPGSLPSHSFKEVDMNHMIFGAQGWDYYGVQKKDVKALFFIQQVVAETIFPQISTATNSKEVQDPKKGIKAQIRYLLLNFKLFVESLKHH